MIRKKPESPHQIESWELAKLVLKRDEEKDWRLLDNPNQLKILTIDSFCAGLIKQMPTVSWGGGPLEIIESAKDLYREASKRLLEKIEKDDHVGDRVRIILNHLDNSKTAFLGRINQLYQIRDKWMIHFFDEFKIDDDKRKYYESKFSKLIESTLVDLCSDIPNELISIIPIASFSGKNCLKDNPQSLIASLEDITSIPAHQINDLCKWESNL